MIMIELIESFRMISTISPPQYDSTDGRTFWKKLNEHVITLVPCSLFQCGKCLKEYPGKYPYNMIKHIEHAHFKGKLFYECKHCGYVSLSQQDHTNHEARCKKARGTQARHRL